VQCCYLGVLQDRGINYRTLDEIFKLASKRAMEAQYTISLSMMEVGGWQIYQFSFGH
jgi:hypothetical protein